MLMRTRLSGRTGMLGITATVALFIGLMWWGFWRTVDVIDTVPVAYGDVESDVAALGTLQPHGYVDVGAQVSGQVRRIVVRAGSVVEKDDLLLEIDPSIQQAKVDADKAALDSLRAQLAEAEARHDLALRQAERQRRLNASGATRLEDVEIADADARVATARIASLRAQVEGAQSVSKGDAALLGYTRIYAPIAGTVVTLDAREGQTLNATYQTPIVLRIADLSKMTVWTEVSEADIGKVQPDMPVYFTTLGGDADARRWIGRVRQILPAPPNRSGGADGAGAPGGASGKVVLYTVLFDVDNADGALMPQMSAQVFFVLARAEHVLVAPLSALQPIDGRPGWYTTRIRVHGRVDTREVQVGVRDRLHAEVLSGLEAGDQLVTAIRRERAGAGRFRW